MALSNWLCKNSTKNMFVKIVFPGGRVELHDRPILAAEIMEQYPKCCVAHPDVFRHPQAVVPPGEVLMLGQKFYVVPINTLRKLRRVSWMNDPTSLHHGAPSESDNEGRMDAASSDASTRGSEKVGEGGARSDGGCISCLVSGKYKVREDATDSGSSSMELNRGTQRDARKENNGSPNSGMKSTSLATLAYYWQPSLQSINEE